MKKIMPSEAVVAYVEKNNEKYVRYKSGADLYSMKERSFMNLAKEANAVRKIDGVSLVNIDIVNQYIKKCRGGNEMSMKRNTIDELELKGQVRRGERKYVSYDEGAILYSLGKRSFMNLAKEANAVRRIKGRALVNIDIVDEYIEMMCA